MALTKLEIRLEAETTRLQKDLDRANRKMKRFAGRASKSAKAAGAAFKKLGFAAGIAAGGMALLVRNSLAAGDELAKTADKLGTSTEKLAGLQHAAELTGVAQKTLNKALTKQQKALFDADRGLLTYSQHFDKLGLSTEKLMALDPIEQFKAIGDAMNKLKNQTDKTAIAYDLFGGRGTALLNTLKLGTKGLEEIAKEAEVLGIALNRVDAAKMEEANDTFVRMKGVMKGLGNSITIAIAPVLDALGKQFIAAAVESGGMVKFIGKGMNKLVAAVGFVADAFSVLKTIWKGLELAFAITAKVIVGIISTIMLPLRAALKAMAPFNEKAAAAADLIEGSITSVFDNVEVKRKEFVAAMDAPLPSAGIKKFVDEAIAEGERLAQAKVAQLEQSQAGFDDPNADTTALEAALAKKIEKIDESLMTQQEREATAFENRQFMIEEAFQLEVITWEKRNQLLEGLEAKHKKKMSALDGKSGKAKLALAKGITSNLASLMNSGSKREFEIGKAAAKATAVIKGIEAVQSAYAAGSKVGGPVVGAAYAATAVVATKANIDAISSQQFGGGGSISSASTGGSVADLTDIPSQAETQAAQGPQEINIIIEGVVDRDAAQRIADSLRDLKNDGGRLFA